MKYTIKNKRIPDAFDGCRIAVLTDLHENQLGKNNRDLIRKIDDCSPDLIVCPGDMLVCRRGELRYQVGIHLLSELARKYPVYCSSGNHELRLVYRGQRGHYEKMLRDAGVHLIDNTSVEIQRSGEKIVLSGLRLERRFYPGMQHSAGKRNVIIKKNPEMEAGYMESRLGKKPDDFTVLLAHSPHYFPNYAEWGADLILSGHCHGGVVRLPIIGGLISNGTGTGLKFDKGIYKRGRSVMVLSAGLGMHTVNFRLNNPSELVMVTLRRNG